MCISIFLKLNLAVKRELIKLDLIGPLTNKYLGSVRGIEASLLNLSILPVSHCAAIQCHFLPDTGKAQGKEFDLSATVVVGFGGSVSGSVGYGQTNGSKNWIEEQTRITAKDKVDIRTENHTQLDGALIASDSGNLKLDTNTLGYSDIAGKDKEHGYYLNVGVRTALAATLRRTQVR